MQVISRVGAATEAIEQDTSSSCSIIKSSEGDIRLIPMDMFVREPRWLIGKMAAFRKMALCAGNASGINDGAAFLILAIGTSRKRRT